MKKSNIPPAPAGLSKEAGAWWLKIAGEWVLDDSALLVLQGGLEALDRMREAQALIVKHGILSPDRFGQLKTNPAVLVERDSRAAVLAAFRALKLDVEPLNPTPGRPAGR